MKGVASKAKCAINLVSAINLAHKLNLPRAALMLCDANIH